jgi:hypothetical protein
MTPSRDERQARRTQNSPLFELARVLVRFDHDAFLTAKRLQEILTTFLAMRPFGPSTRTMGCDSRKVCSARRADFGVFGHLIPAVANERSYRHASAKDEKWNANDCTDHSPAK